MRWNNIHNDVYVNCVIMWLCEVTNNSESLSSGKAWIRLHDHQWQLLTVSVNVNHSFRALQIFLARTASSLGGEKKGPGSIIWYDDNPGSIWTGGERAMVNMTRLRKRHGQYGEETAVVSMVWKKSDMVNLICWMTSSVGGLKGLDVLLSWNVCKYYV